MPGYRSGFAAGDPAIIAALKRYRPNVGVAPQTFIQRAAAAAWADEDHVAEVRERYRAKRDALLPALLEAGLEPSGGDASFFLWLRVPGGEDAEAYALRLLDEHGIVDRPRARTSAPAARATCASRSSRRPADCRRAADLLASGA